jgi:hypothetical protein
MVYHSQNDESVRSKTLCGNPPYVSECVRPLPECMIPPPCACMGASVSEQVLDISCVSPQQQEFSPLKSACS